MTSTLLFLAVMAAFVAAVCLIDRRFSPLRRFSDLRIPKPAGITFISGEGQIESGSYRCVCSGTIAGTLTSDSFYPKRTTILFFTTYWKFPESALRRSDQHDHDYTLVANGQTLRLSLRVEHQ